MAEEKAFHVSSGYGANTKRPYVEFESPSLKVQMSPQEARDLALKLLQAAEGAESDGFLVEFILNQVGGEMHEAAGLLQMYREWREALWREKYG